MNKFVYKRYKYPFQSIDKEVLSKTLTLYNNIDAELTAILSEQIAAEIDREILRSLRKAAIRKQTMDFP